MKIDKQKRQSKNVSANWKKKIVACQGGLPMKIVTFLPEKWFHTIKPISLQFCIKTFQRFTI